MVKYQIIHHHPNKKTNKLTLLTVCKFENCGLACEQDGYCGVHLIQIKKLDRQNDLRVRSSSSVDRVILAEKEQAKFVEQK